MNLWWRCRTPVMSLSAVAEVEALARGCGFNEEDTGRARLVGLGLPPSLLRHGDV